MRCALDVHYRIDALESRENHRVFELEFVLFLVVTVVVNFGEVQLAFFDAGNPGVGRPLDVAVTHLRFEH